MQVIVRAIFRLREVGTAYLLAILTLLPAGVAHAALSLDTSTPAAVTGNTLTQTTASFMPPSGSILIVNVMSDEGGSAVSFTVTDNLTTHLTYHSIGGPYGNSSNDARVQSWWAAASVTQPLTVSVTKSAGAYSMVRVLVITGADTSAPIGAAGGGRGTSTNLSLTYASTKANSWGWITYCDWKQAGAPTAGSGESIDSSYNPSGYITAAVIKESAATPTAGTRVTLSTATPASNTQTSWSYFEILPSGSQSGGGSAPTISSFRASPTSITSGAASTLSWTVAGSPTPTLSIDNGVGDVSGRSSQSVSPAQTTTYTLTAQNSVGSITATATVTVTVPDNTAPSIPTGLTAKAVSSSQVNLTWNPSSDNVGVTGYKVFRGGTQIGTANTASYSDPGLSPSTTYSYTVSAYDAAGNNSNQSVATPVTTPASSGTNTLALDVSTPPAVTSTAATQTTASFLPPGGSVLIVNAMSDEGNSAVTFTVTDNLATHLTYHSIGGPYGNTANDGRVQSWWAVISASQPMTVSVAKPAAGNSMLRVLVITGANTAAPIGAAGGGRGTTANLRQTYTSTASNSWGWATYVDWKQAGTPTAPAGESIDSSYNASGFITAAVIRQNAVTPSAGATVTMSTATPSSGTQITWSYFEILPPQGPSAPTISSFTANPSSITQGTASTLSWAVAGNPVPTLSIDNGVGDVSGLSSKSVAPAQTTLYTLTAQNSVGSVTSSVTVTVGAADTTAPSIPTGLSASAASSSQINLSWTRSNDNVGVTGYRVFRGGSQVGTAATNSYSDSGLSPVTTYSYTVSAYDAAGNNSNQSSPASATTESRTNVTLRYHTLVLDNQNLILPWYSPAANAYDQYLRQLWVWLPTVPKGPSSSLPMYYLYDGFKPTTPISVDNWENDWGERVPNIVEFARLYYAYTGDQGPLTIAKGLIDYALAHAMTSPTMTWPNFPYGAANGGATEINGANVVWQQYDVLTDLGSDMGMSFYKMYLLYGTPAYRNAAIGTADTLASNIQAGSATNSPWPYVVGANTGAVHSRYTSNFAGALRLFDLPIQYNEPNAAAYSAARDTLRTWILQYPMQNGNWVDGHSDVHIDGNTNWSNMAKSNMNLYILDNPDFDPNYMTDVPKLLKWTEDNLVNVQTPDNLPGQYYGAYVVAEQFAYMYRMGYQTARQAAEYAAWYAISGDATYKDRAYRGFNYNTYMMMSSGQSSDGPTETVGHWWGDDYGEGPRMYFRGMAAVPEWAPPGQNHILYSQSILTNVALAAGSVQYTTTDPGGIEYLRLTYQPASVTVGGTPLTLRTDLAAEGYTVRDLGGGDFAVTIKRAHTGIVSISATN